MYIESNSYVRHKPSPSLCELESQYTVGIIVWDIAIACRELATVTLRDVIYPKKSKSTVLFSTVMFKMSVIDLRFTILLHWITLWSINS